MTSEAIMFISLGFATATLFAFLITDFLVKRAYKKAANQFRGQIPINEIEMQAERDRLRADHAINTAKTEHKLTSLQQDDVKHRVEISRLKERLQTSDETLNKNLRRAVRAEEANDVIENSLNYSKDKIKLKDNEILKLNRERDAFSDQQKQYQDSLEEYQLTQARFLKISNDRDALNKEKTEFAKENVELGAQLTVEQEKNIQLEKTASAYEAKIQELSTENLFLSQQLFAKELKLDMSNNAVDRYKDKLLKQKMTMRETTIGKKALRSIKNKLGKNTPQPAASLKQNDLKTHEERKHLQTNKDVILVKEENVVSLKPKQDVIKKPAVIKKSGPLSINADLVKTTKKVATKDNIAEFKKPEIKVEPKFEETNIQRQDNQPNVEVEEKPAASKPRKNRLRDRMAAVANEVAE